MKGVFGREFDFVVELVCVFDGGYGGIEYLGFVYV